LEIGARILDVAAAFDLVFWPVALDFKVKDVEALPDQSIDLCLFNGAIRTSENEHMAHLLRAKSKVLVAFGACANWGGIPGLANLTTRQGIFERVYCESPSTVNSQGVGPQPVWAAPEGELRLPEFYDQVRTLAQTVAVDYFVPGCPPVAKQIAAVLDAVITGHLPPPGSVVGAGDRAVCDECSRVREEKKIRRFYRPHELIPDPQRCLLEQGIVCAGSATRSGCGALCPGANMPCRGCYGPLAGSMDQGAAMLSALASIVDSTDEREIKRILDGVVDPAGTFYRFSLAHSLLGRARMTR
jgi:F420-non-reducing hydrogenase small subunit